MKHRAGVCGVFNELLIQTRHNRRNHQVSKSVSSSSEHIRDAGVNTVIITRVSGQLVGYEVGTNNGSQVVSESDNLKDRKHFNELCIITIPSIVIETFL